MIQRSKDDDFLRTLTLLYVEDNKDAREQLASFLERRIGTLVTADDGAAGLKAFRMQNPHMVVTDIQLPEMDGLTMSQEIRKLDPSIPIIVTTAFEQTDYLLRSIDIGIDKYVTKPVDPSQLHRAMLDCAHRLLAERQVELSAKVFDSNLEAIVITNADNHILSVNRSFTGLTGYDPEEVIGRSPDFLFSEKNNLRTYADIRRQITAKGSWCGEMWSKQRNGDSSPDWLSITTLTDPSGRITHHIAIFSDISERKRTEQALRDAMKASEAANIAKSEFLANMSHEIRTPMNGILGMTGLLLRSDLNSEQRRYAEIVIESGQSLLTIINDILDLSKIEARKLEMESLDFDLRMMLEDITDISAVQAQQKGLNLACLVNPDVPSLLSGDPGRLRQTLVNLIGNAIKFTPAGEVAIQVFLDKEDKQTVTLRFTIRDTGIGIPQDQIETIFSPFVQADGSTTRKYGGTGLGLAISKQITELMGGTIGCKSDLGKGSVFWFTAVFGKQPLTDVPHAKQQANLKDINVLVVDDHALNRLLLLTLLKSWGCRCDEADSAEAALTKLCQAVVNGDPFRIALLDMNLPKTNGEALGSQIKSVPLLKDTILVMISSIGHRGDAARLQSIGFAAFLPKPIRRSQLYDCLVLALGQTEQPDKHAAGECLPQESPERLSGSVAGGQIITQYTISESFKRSARILVVEDNTTNQEVAKVYMEKFGYRVDIAANGAEAVHALQRIPYNLVLMDCQMPVMDMRLPAAFVTSEPVFRIRISRLSP